MICDYDWHFHNGMQEKGWDSKCHSNEIKLHSNDSSSKAVNVSPLFYMFTKVLCIKHKKTNYMS